MKIKLARIYVNDQDKALKFYTEVCGMEKKVDITAGNYRWLTLIFPNSPDFELLLEPNANPSAKAYQNALFEQGQPSAFFSVDDTNKEFEHLKGLGVKFKTEPTKMGPVTFAVFDDGLGNLVQLVQGG